MGASFIKPIKLTFRDMAAILHGTSHTIRVTRRQTCHGEHRADRFAMDRPGCRKDHQAGKVLSAGSSTSLCRS